MTAYVDPRVRKALDDERKRNQVANGGPTTVTGLVLAAIEQAAPQLDDLVKRARPAVRTGGLFSYQEAPERPATTQIGFRVPGRDLKVLDELADRHCSGVRSTLIELALRSRYDLI